MASIDNRSNYIVTVRNRDDLTRAFPYNKRDDAAAYFAELTEQGFKPQVQQLEDKILVRIRDKGWEPQAGRFDSLKRQSCLSEPLSLTGHEASTITISVPVA